MDFRNVTHAATWTGDTKNYYSTAQREADKRVTGYSYDCWYDSDDNTQIQWTKPDATGWKIAMFITGGKEHPNFWKILELNSKLGLLIEEV